MRKTKVEGEYQSDPWPKGPETSLCPLERPDIAMGLESQIEAWSARCLRCLKTPGSHCQFASSLYKSKDGVESWETASVRDRFPEKPSAERRGGLGCQGKRHRGRRRNTLDIPLHRRDLGGRAAIRSQCPHPDSSTRPSASLGMTGQGPRTTLISASRFNPSPACIP